jgi:hypothetical protein
MAKKGPMQCASGLTKRARLHKRQSPTPASVRAACVRAVIGATITKTMKLVRQAEGLLLVHVVPRMLEPGGGASFSKSART